MEFVFSKPTAVALFGKCCGLDYVSIKSGRHAAFYIFNKNQKLFPNPNQNFGSHIQDAKSPPTRRSREFSKTENIKSIMRLYCFAKR